MNWHKCQNRLLAVTLTVATVLGVTSTARTAPPEGTFVGYVSARGLVRDESGMPIWVEYPPAETVKDANHQDVVLPTSGVPIWQKKVSEDESYRDAVVIPGTEYRFYVSSYASLLATMGGNYLKVRADEYKATTYEDINGDECVKRNLRPNTTIAFIRSESSRTPGAELVIGEFPFDPESTDTVDAAIQSVLIGTRGEAQGKVLRIGNGIISYQADFMSARPDTDSSTAFGFCSESTDTTGSITLENGQTRSFVYSDPVRRFDHCDSWRIAKRANGLPKVWAPIVGAYVDIGARYAYPSTQAPRTDENGYYTLTYPYLPGSTYFDDIHVIMAFAPNDPRVPFGSRYMTKRQVVAGATTSVNPGTMQSIATGAQEPVYQGSSPEADTWAGYDSGLLQDDQRVQSQNFPIDVSYILGPVMMANEARGTIPVDASTPTSIRFNDDENKTEYVYARPSAQSNISVDVPYPTALWQGTSGGAPSTTGTSAQPTYSRIEQVTAGAGSGTAAATTSADQQILGELVDRGLVKHISREDLSNTDLYVFAPDGNFMAARKRLRSNETFGISCTTASNDPFAPDALNKQCQVGEDQRNGAAGFNLQTFVQASYPGARYRILLLNRATGYVGTGYAQMQGTQVRIGSEGETSTWRPSSGLEASSLFAKDGSTPILMRPPNLTVRALRTPQNEGGLDLGNRQFLVGFEGAGLSSDRIVKIETEWLDWDGSALPDKLPALAGFVGRLARVADASKTLDGANSTIGNFEIRPGSRTIHIKTADEEWSNRNFHYYVQVSGASAESCGVEPSCLSPEGKSGNCTGNAGCSVFNGAQGTGPLASRPATYAPVKVPVFNQTATKDALKVAASVAKQAALASPDTNAAYQMSEVAPVYEYVYRPEYQFTVYELPELSNAQAITQWNSSNESSEMSLSFGYDLDTYEGYSALPSLGSLNSPIWSVGYQELLALANSPEPTTRTFVGLQDLLALAPGRQILEVQNVAQSLSSADFLGLQLYLANDRGNALYQNYSTPLILADATPIDFHPYENMAQFGPSVPNPKHVEDYEVIGFYLTRAASLSLSARVCDKDPIPIISSTMRDEGMHYFIIDTQKLRELKLPNSFVLELIAERSGDERLPGKLTHRVEFPTSITTHQIGRTLGEVVEHDVNLVDGSVRLSRSDFALEGYGPNLAFERTYSNTGGGGLLGSGWHHSYENKLTPVATDDLTADGLPEWVVASRKAFLLEEDPTFQEHLNPSEPPEVNMVLVNGTSFRKQLGVWIRETGRYGELFEDATQPCVADDTTAGCFTYTASDGTQYRYRAPEKPKPLSKVRTMLSLWDGLAQRVGLDPAELRVRDVPPGQPEFPRTRMSARPLLSITDRYDHVTTLSYTNGRLSLVKDAYDRECEFAYEPYPGCDPSKSSHCDRLKRIECLKDGTASEKLDVDFDYDPQGNLSRVTRGRRVEEYTYVARQSCGYSDYDLESITKAGGGVTTFAYCDGDDDDIEDLGPNRDPVRRRDMVETVTKPVGQADLTATFTYDNPTTRNVIAGNLTKAYTLNAFGNPTQIVEAGKTTTLSWGDPGSDGSSNQLTSRTVSGRTITYGYDEYGNVASETGPGPRRIDQTWNRKGLLLSRRDWRGFEETWTYEQDVLPSTYVDGANNTTAYVPHMTGDLKGRIRTETVMGGPGTLTKEYSYDRLGNLTAVTNVNTGNGTAYGRDLRGRITSSIDADGNTTRFGYSQNDEVESVTYPDLVATPGLPVGTSNSVVQYTYDYAGNRETEDDRNGNKLTHTYYPSGALHTTSRSFGDGQRTFSYDAQGNLASETDWLGRITTYGYDDAGQRNSVTNRNGDTMMLQHDADGRLTYSKDYGGLETVISYDDLGGEKTRRLICAKEDCGLGTTRSLPSDEGVSGAPPNAVYFVTETDARGFATTLGYDGRERLVYKSSPLGVLTWIYDGAGLLTQMTNEHGAITSHSYDEDGYLAGSVTEGSDGSVVTTSYVNSPGGKTQTATEDGITTTYTYDSWGRVTSRSVPGQQQEEFSYDGEGNIVASRDAGGGLRTWERDGLGRVLAYVDAVANNGASQKQYSNTCVSVSGDFTSCYEYDGNGNVNKSVNARGVATTFQFDNEGHETSRTVSGEKSYTRHLQGLDPMGNPATVIGFDGIAVSYTYTDRHAVMTKTVPGYGQTRYVYSPTGQLLSETLPNTLIRTYDYDPVGRLLSTVYHDVAGTEIPEARHTYLSRVETSENQAHSVTTDRYDDLHRLVSRTRTDSSGTEILVSENEYDPTTGRIIATTDGSGIRVTYSNFDVRGLPQTLTPTGAPATHRTYYPSGRIQTETRPGGYVTNYQYDAEGRVLSQQTGKETTTYAWDGAGNLVRETTAGSQVRAYAYDEFSRMTSATDGALVTNYVFNGRGLLERVDGPGGATVSYGYDGSNRLTSETVSGAPARTFSNFDSQGNPRTVTEPNGRAAQFTYDHYDRVATATYAPRSDRVDVRSTTWTYEDSLARLSIAEQKTIPGGGTRTDTIVETRDRGFGWLLESNQRGRRIAHEYYGDGLARTTTVGSSADTYQYDALRRPDSVVTANGMFDYGHDDSARTTTINYPNATSAQIAYNAEGRIASIGHSLPNGERSELSYQYDNDGNPVSITDTTTGVTDVTTFDLYDSSGRLVRFTQGGRTTVYTFEGYDRKTETVHQGTEGGQVLKSRAYDYDQSRRLERVTESAPGVADVVTTYSYDDNGNLVSRIVAGQPEAATTFSYNSRDQLVRVTRGPPGSETVLGEYDYDVHGNRIQEIGGDRGDIDSVYDAGELIEESISNGSDSGLHRYHYGHALLSQVGPSGAEYFHQDFQGTTRAISKDPGNETATLTHDPWGNVRAQSGEANSNITYTQQQYDTSTGLYYYGARYYDPVSGRFITEDKASGNHATPASLNRYTYAYNSPARYIDPTGNTATEANPGLSGTGAVSSSLNSGEPEVIGAAGGLLTRMPPSKTGWARLTYQDRTGRTYEGVADSDIVMFVGPVSQPPTFYATAPAMAGSYGWVPTEMEYAIIRQQLPRIVSGVQAIAGASEIYGGGSLALAGGGAIAACIASGACAAAAFVGGGAAVLMGTFGVANGVDDVQAGIRGAYSNSYEASFKHRYSYAVARAAGASRERADLIATGIEIGVGFGVGFGSAAAAGALRSATNLERLAAQGVRHLDSVASADARLASRAAGMADDAARTADTASGRIAAAARGASTGAESAMQAAQLSRQLASREIAGGHSFVKHVVERGEFPGIRTRAEFGEMIEGVMGNASHVRQLSGGRTAFWRDGVVVIRNPGAVDGGTAFVPTNGFSYFQGLK